MDNGRVAALDEVERAVTRGWETAAKNFQGDKPDAHQAIRGRTTRP
jgi:hypothetical protein